MLPPSDGMRQPGRAQQLWGTEGVQKVFFKKIGLDARCVLLIKLHASVWSCMLSDVQAFFMGLLTPELPFVHLPRSVRAFKFCFMVRTVMHGASRLCRALQQIVHGSSCS
jgi:hypothetical protein